MDMLGLSHDEAARRLAQSGPNELPAPPRRGVLKIIVETLREPMFALLIGAAVLYLALGDLGEGLFMLGGAGMAVGCILLARIERHFHHRHTGRFPVQRLDDVPLG